MEYATAIRVFDEDGNQVGAAPVDEIPEPDGVITFEGKTYRWHPRVDQWREDAKPKR